MRKIGKLAVIGSGPSAFYFLMHLWEEVENFRDSLGSVVVFEKTSLAGYGMPYHPETTDRFNRSNISSEELPELPEKFVEWLLARDREELAGWGIEKSQISESEVYCRLALGEYFHEQFHGLVARLREAGIAVDVRCSCAVEDIEDGPDRDCVRIFTNTGGSEDFDTVVIATGHRWQNDDRAKEGFYSSPWPIFKLLPGEGKVLNHAVGTLGASLSAFDVVSSLSHRQGKFEETDGELAFHPFEKTENFEVVMHAAEGWLPHLQWDQVEAMREIYRHVSREKLLSLRDENGLLRFEKYFDQVCRPALLEAFREDGMQEMVRLLRDESFGIEDFVDEMSERHQYVDSFEGLRKELSEARDSVENHRPIHWKEILDDLMYCLNYHAELLPAEDHLLLKKTVMSFLMNVIAAMPLQSARMLLALHDAGKVRLEAGKVKVEGKGKLAGSTRVSIESEEGDQDGENREVEYRMFIDCSGQKKLGLEDFAFQSLVKSGAVREARADFRDQEKAMKLDDEELLEENGGSKLRIGGIDIDAAFCIIGNDGVANPRIHDLSFPHTSGVRPYSYGLQACSATAGIVVNAWLAAIQSHCAEKGDLVRVSRIYEDF